MGKPMHPLGRLRARRKASRGMTLVELMVGLLLGLITTVVIAQVLVASEGRRRGMAIGSDAQVNGALSLYDLQRQIQAAGYGMNMRSDAFGCTLKARLSGTDFSWIFQPMVLTDGANGAPDTITINASSKGSYAAPIRLNANFDMPNTDNSMVINTTLGVEPGDFMIIVPKLLDASHYCSLFTATSAAAGMVHFDAGSTAPWNQSPGSLVFPSVGYLQDSVLINMGSVSSRTYTVASETLRLAQLDMTTGLVGASQDLYPEVVNMQAYYGKDTDGDGAVDVYNTVQPVTGTDWAQVRTVRLAIVTRSVQWEREEVTPSQPVWDLGAAPTVTDAREAACGTSQCVPLKVDAVADWKHYRYKVFDTVIPMRNILWGGS